MTSPTNEQSAESVFEVQSAICNANFRNNIKIRQVMVKMRETENETPFKTS